MMVGANLPGSGISICFFVEADVTARIRLRSLLFVLELRAD
jgi:hypothetical protein